MTRRIVDPGELPEVKELLGRLAEVDQVGTPAHVKDRFGELTAELDAEGLPPAPAYTFPEYTTYFWCDGPVIPVRFADGVTVEFRPGSPYFPRQAKVHGRGIDIRGLRLDFDVDMAPDGELASILRPWKTGVNGVDGAEDVPERYRVALLALCKRRAKEAREALGVVTGQRRPR